MLVISNIYLNYNLYFLRMKMAIETGLETHYVDINSIMLNFINKLCYIQKFKDILIMDSIKLDEAYKNTFILLIIGIAMSILILLIEIIYFKIIFQK